MAPLGARLLDLDLSGSLELTEVGLAAVTSAHTRLSRLSLWNCLRVGPAGLAASLPRLGGRLRHLSLRGLQQLDDDTLEAVLAGLPGLTGLDLRACERLTGTGLAGAGGGAGTGVPARRPALTSLSLRGCYRVRGPESAAAIASLGPALRDLSLRDNWQWSAQDLGAALGGLAGLTCLDLSGLRNVSPAPAGGGGLPGLVVLAPSLITLRLAGMEGLRNGALSPLAGAAAGGGGPPHLHPHPLTSIDLTGCNGLDGAGLAPLGSGCPALATVRMAHCQGIKTRDDLGALGGMARLTWLDLTDCASFEAGGGVGALGGCASLRTLSLEGCRSAVGIDAGLVELVKVRAGGRAWGRGAWVERV